MLADIWPCLLITTMNLFEDTLPCHTHTHARAQHSPNWATRLIYGTFLKSLVPPSHLPIQIFALRTRHVFFMHSVACFRRGIAQSCSQGPGSAASCFSHPCASWTWLPYIQPSHFPLAWRQEVEFCQIPSKEPQSAWDGFVQTETFPCSTSRGVLIS